jgi:hypothetical protein
MGRATGSLIAAVAPSSRMLGDCVMERGTLLQYSLRSEALSTLTLPQKTPKFQDFCFDCVTPENFESFDCHVSCYAAGAWALSY